MVVANGVVEKVARIFIVLLGLGAPGLSHAVVPGERVPVLDAVDVDGKHALLPALAGPKGIVLITRDVECPVSQRYLPRIDEMAVEFRKKGFSFLVLDVSPHARAEAKIAAAKVPNVRTLVDERGAVSAALRAETTAEAFVIDRAGTLRYRGAIDDQYGVTYQRAKVQSAWLREALDKVAVDEEPAVTSTEPPGCAMAPLARGAEARSVPVTYHNRASRIIQSRCQVCHRVGGLGPMPLESYRDVYARRAAIAAMVRTGIMPPWSARHSVGEWANDRSLSEREKSDLLGWIDKGAPEGDSKEAPLPRRFTSEWNIGKPDAIVAIPEPIHVPAQGVVAYKNVYVQTQFSEDKWITAVEIRPTQPKVVHHVIVVLEEPGRKPLTPEQIKKLKPGEPIPPHPVDTATEFFAITVPGSLGIKYPPGTGKRLAKGAWLRFEIHYQPNGADVMDRTEIGFRFSAAPLREVQSLSAVNTTFKIPPNNPGYKVVASHKITEPGKLLSLFPHMHLRGKAFRFELKYPDGSRRALLDVPKFDFNWQSYYELRTALDVPAGAEIVASAWFDNSKGNPWNPDPSQTVRWGQQTTEEMMIGYFDFVADAGRK